MLDTSTLRVAGERRRAVLGHEPQDVLEHLVFGVGEAHAVGDLLEEPGCGVHVAHEVAHVLERRLVGLDDDREARVDGHEVVVGDDDGHLDELVDLEVEAGHLAVHPHETIGSLAHASTLGVPAVARVALGSRRV